MKSNKLLEKSAAENKLSHILKKGSGGGSIRKKGGRFQKPLDKPKTRKELRKELRKNKKAAKHNYLLAKCGKTLVEDTSGKKKRKRKNRKRKRKPALGEDSEGRQDKPADNPKVTSEEPGKYVKIRHSEDHYNSAKAVSQRSEDDKELEQLKKEMEETRKRRLAEENAEEDRFISKMEKKLRLNKKAKIPESFRTDGLDYLLELCQSSGKTKKGKAEVESQSSNRKKASVDDEELEGEDESLSEGDGSENDVDVDSELDEDINEEENEVEEGDDSEEEEDETSSVEQEEEIDSGASDDEEEMESEGDYDDDSENDDEKTAKKSEALKPQKSKKKEDDLWEDIYGRLRRKDGSIVDEKAAANANVTVAKDIKSPATATTSRTSEVKPGKYVPPMQRKDQTQRDKITRSLKGLLNRLSEANMHTISKQVEELYMANSRNEMNACLLELVYAVLLRNVSMPERVIFEHVMLIATLHANIGTEIGAFFIQKFVQDFREKYDSNSIPEDSKELENLLLLISSMYHFKIVDACLLYDLLKLLASNFEPRDVELILAVLRNIGFRLRKDDPVELKALIILIQQKATAPKTSPSSAKVKFMLEVVTAIRNNNMSKIPNYDPSVGDHLQKILKSHIHKGNYVSTMKIKMEDLLNAETKGRWWIVGSAWSNIDADKSADLETLTSIPTKDKQQNEKLLEKARALGMNTETRKTIFCILMTAEDYVDAFTKINQLDLKNNQERELIHVTTYCCLHEKQFNPYYGLICSKLCTLDRKHMLTLQYNLWDRLKDLNNLKSYQLMNLAKFLVHLINDKSLPLSSLKVIEYAEMDKVKLKFLKEVLCGILLQDDEDNVQEIFFKSATSENLTLFRESLRLFMGHFLLQENVITSDGENVGCDIDPDKMDVLKSRIKIAETAMSLGRSRVQL